MQIGRRVRTEAGRAADKASKKAQRQSLMPLSRGRPTERQSSKPMSDEEKPKRSGKPMRPQGRFPRPEVDGVRRRRPDEQPRVYKTGKRVYGSRILRVNRYLRETVEA